MANLFRIESINTHFFVVSSKEDQAGQEVDTRPGNAGIPPNSILNIVPPIEGQVTVAYIRGESGLYVSLIGEAEDTKLTWASEKYTWIIRETATGPFVITPANGADLFWVDEFGVGIGDHVEVKSGGNIQPPQNEWSFARAT